MLADHGGDDARRPARRLPDTSFDPDKSREK